MRNHGGKFLTTGKKSADTLPENKKKTTAGSGKKPVPLKKAGTTEIKEVHLLS